MQFADEISVIVTAITPVLEVRASVPLAIAVFKMSIWKSVILSLVGNVGAAIFLPLILNIVESSLVSFPRIASFMNWWSRRAEKAFNHKYRALGVLGLAVFVGIPLPGTGVWTGAVAAWILRMKKSESIFALSIGAVIATFAMVVITLGVTETVRNIFG
ncbi:MAG: small multi-drug export protein [Patescibacteria group bacterium]